MFVDSVCVSMFSDYDMAGANIPGMGLEQGLSESVKQDIGKQHY